MLIAVLTVCFVVQPALAGQDLSGVTLTISRWAGPHADAIKDLVKRFEEMTGAKVIVDAIPYGSLRERQILDAISGTGTFDILWLSETWLSEYAKRGLLHPLEGFVRSKAVTGPEFSLDNFIPSILHTGYSKGTLYALPDFVQTTLLFYREDLFDEAGLAEPEDWEDILADAEYFDRREGLHGIAWPARRGGALTHMWASLLWSAGGDYFDTQGNPQVNSEEGIAALSWMCELIKYAPEAALNWHWDGAMNSLIQGETALGFCLSGIASWTTDPDRSPLAGKFGYTALKKEGTPIGVLMDWNYAINKDSKHPEAAYRLIQWLTDTNQQKYLFLNSGSLGATKAFYQDPELSNMPWIPATQQALEYARLHPLIPEFPEIKEVLFLHLSQALIEEETPKEALDIVNEEIEKILGK